MQGSNMRGATYRRCLVAYVDILGFKEVIKSLGAEQVRRQLVLAQRVGRIPKREAGGFGEYRFKSFSDSVSMSVPVSHGCLSFFLLHVHRFQRELANQGIFVRGAIVVGDHFYNTRMLFGPALVQAVELEKRASVWPRVVVHPDVIKLFDDCALWLDPKQPERELIQSRQLLRCDYGGISYIDYLRHYLRYFREYENTTKEADVFAGNHRSHIIEQIEKAKVNQLNPNVLAKYHWLATYHNSVMSEVDWGHLDVEVPGFPVGL